MPMLFALMALLLSPPLFADIPATPVMTLYVFNGPLELPYYEVENIGPSGPGAPAGRLTQGTSLIPCLPIRDGKPVTDATGTPYVGFEVVVDPRQARDESATERFRAAVAERKTARVENHHCPSSVRHALDVRNLYPLEKAPFFLPAPASDAKPRPAPGASELDRLVRAFHASGHCDQANRRLTERRAALEHAWEAFMREQRALGVDLTTVARAKHLDYVMRTALFEGHLGRGCSAYGACERNIVALSIRNRAVGQCLAYQGCTFPGDFQGVASKVSQYNIWDEFLTQISGLTSCYLRPDLADDERFGRWQRMYAQNVGDVERILYGSDADLNALFPGMNLAELKQMRHYYHAPAMGKCFPTHPRMEYISGAIARSGDSFALLANQRIEVGERLGEDYAFKRFLFEEEAKGDRIRIEDQYPGFVVDGRKVELRTPRDCKPWGIPPGCAEGRVGRYRKVPPWLDAGRPLGIRCRIEARGESCNESASWTTTEVGGACDKEMRPVAAVR